MNQHKFLSHPDYPLREHLKDVAQRSARVVDSLQLNWDELNLDKSYFKRVAYLIGLCHDFGKYTTFFQRHLLKGDKNEKSRHAFLSAIFTAWCLEQMLSKMENPYIPLVGFFTVFHHHTDLTYPDDDIPLKQYLEDPPLFIKAPDEPQPHRTRLCNTHKQLEDIKIHAIGEIKAFYEAEELHNIEGFLNSDWLATLQNLRRLWNKFQEESEDLKLKIFWIILILYSILLDSDKKSAINLPPLSRKYIPSNLVDLYKKERFADRSSHPLAALREKIYTSVMERIDALSLDKHLFSLTAPTGSGKTLTALALALKLRERIKREKGYFPRIIYALPFINIIEQNYQVFRDVLSTGISDFQEKEHGYLIAHHHLAEVLYRDEERERTPEEAYHLIESWDSEIIVTTFVQLFYSIIGHKGSFLRKLHNIVGSIVLLDEVQSVPVEYWEVIGKVFSSMVRNLNCYVILLTATQPFILPEEEKIELVESPSENFKGLNRVILRFRKDIRGEQELMKWLPEIYEPRYSYLLVVNTIPTSIEMYLKVREILKPPHLFYLSTNIIPKHRRERIEKIKALLGQGQKVFLVSTQVVEAGVDLDFDIAIRDIGPLDSLIQIAGRCNREAKKESGEFYVVRLNNEASEVYRSIHISTSLEIFQDIQKEEGWKEEEFPELVNNFFRKIKNKVSTEESEGIWGAILNLRFCCKKTTSISDFRLIKEDIPEVEIFVEIDENASRVWEKFKLLKEEKDLAKRREIYLMLRKQFYDYVVAVPSERVKKNPPLAINEWFYFIPNSQLGNFYSPETGFKWEP